MADRSIRLVILIPLLDLWKWEAAWKSTSVRLHPFWTDEAVHFHPNWSDRKSASFITTKLAKQQKISSSFQAHNFGVWLFAQAFSFRCATIQLSGNLAFAVVSASCDEHCLFCPALLMVRQVSLCFRCPGFLSCWRSMSEILFSIGDALPCLALMLVWVKVNTARSSESHFILGTLLSDSPS